MTFDIELLGNCDAIISELCVRLGWERISDSAQCPMQQVGRDELKTPLMWDRDTETKNNEKAVAGCSHDSQYKSDHLESESKDTSEIKIVPKETVNQTTSNSSSEHENKSENNSVNSSVLPETIESKEITISNRPTTDILKSDHISSDHSSQSKLQDKQAVCNHLTNSNSLESSSCDTELNVEEKGSKSEGCTKSESCLTEEEDSDEVKKDITENTEPMKRESLAKLLEGECVKYFVWSNMNKQISPCHCVYHIEHEVHLFRNS